MGGAASSDRAFIDQDVNELLVQYYMFGGDADNIGASALRAFQFNHIPDIVLCEILLRHLDVDDLRYAELRRKLISTLYSKRELDLSFDVHRHDARARRRIIATACVFAPNAEVLRLRNAALPDAYNDEDRSFAEYPSKSLPPNIRVLVKETTRSSSLHIIFRDRELGWNARSMKLSLEPYVEEFKRAISKWYVANNHSLLLNIDGWLMGYDLFTRANLDEEFDEGIRMNFDDIVMEHTGLLTLVNANVKLQNEGESIDPFIQKFIEDPNGIPWTVEDIRLQDEEPDHPKCFYN